MPFRGAGEIIAMLLLMATAGEELTCITFTDVLMHTMSSRDRRQGLVKPPWLEQGWGLSLQVPDTKS